MHSKMVYRILFLLFCSLTIKAQPTWNWVKNQSTLLNQEAGHSLSLDTVNKFVYSCGYFTNNSAFAGIASSDMNAGIGNGNKDAYLAKHDFNGNLIWVVNIGSVSNDEAHSVSYANDGNIYLTGYCEGTTIFNSLASADFTLNAIAGNKDVFVASYTSNGKVRWAKQGGGTGNDEGQSVVSIKNAVFVMGIYNNNASFGSFLTTNLFGIKQHYFICSYDLSGNEQWLTQAQSNTDDGIGNPFIYSHSKIVCSNDTLFVIGEDGGNNMSFINANGSTFSTVLGNSGSSGSIFYSAMSLTGNWLWCQQILAAGDKPQLGFGITADCAGVYISGSTHPNAPFPSGFQITSADHDLPFIARCSRGTGLDTWVKSWSANVAHESVITNIYADGHGYIYLGGNYRSNNFFAPDANFGLANGTDMFVAKFETSGLFKWAQPIKGLGNNYINDFKISENKITLCGQFESNVSFPGLSTLSIDLSENIYLAQGSLPPDPAIYNCCSPPPSVSLTDPDFSVCAPSATISANSPLNGTGNWYVVEGANSTASGTLSSPLSNATAVNGISFGNNMYTWVISNKFCNPSIDSIKVTRDVPPSIASASSNQTLCINNPSLAVNSNTPAIGTGLWSVLSGTATILSPASPTTFVNSFASGNTVLGWSISNGSCPASVATLTVQTDQMPAPSVAGSNQTLCINNPSLTLSANAPSVGNGLWTLVSGSCSIATPTNPLSIINTLATGTTILQWTTSNGSCPASSSSVSIQVDKMPTPSLAGSNQSVCASSPSGTLAGNTPSSGQGLWSVIGGTGSIVTPTSATSAVNALATGTNILQWMTSNGSCPVSTSTLLITVNQVPASVAGSNQTLCANNPSCTLNANVPAVGNGVWSVLSGTANILSPSSPSTMVNAISQGNTILQWAVNNGVCPTASSTLAIQVDAMPSPAFAGTNQTLCINNPSITLNATPPSIGNGLWSVISGSANLSSPSSATSIASSLSVGTNTLKWTITNGSCPVSTSSVSLQVDQMPTTAAAGSNQTLCANNPSLVLNGNSPVTGNGFWSVITGTANILAPSSPSSQVNPIQTGTNVLQWTINNGSCPASSSSISIQVDFLPNAAAGSNQTVCANNPTVTLNANAPAAGNGLWTLISGSASVVSPTLATSAVNAIATGTTILQWTLTNGSCPASTSTLLLQGDQMPTPSLAGSNQTLCANNPTLVLNANTPTVGTGLWTIISGSAALTSSASPNSSALSIQTGTTVLQWSITNGSCPISTSTLSIQVDQMPTPSFAGSNQTLCANNFSLVLNGNAPSTGNGLWSILTGSASIVSPSSASCAANSIPVGTTVLDWSISNGSCPVSSSSVSIQVDAMPTPALAGNNQTLCANNPTLLLNANTPSVGNGLWSVVSGSASVLSPSLSTTVVSSISTGTTVLQWSITNGSCPVSTSTLSIQVDQMPTAAFAGSNQTLCANNPTLALNANTPLTGTGLWTVLSGSAALSAPSSETTAINVITPGVTVMEWSITNASCPVSTSTLFLQVDEVPSVAFAGNSQTLCAATLTLNANTPVMGYGNWNVITGPGVIVNPSNPSSTVINLALNLNSFEWVVSNGVCPSSKDTVSYVIKGVPDIAATASDYEMCETKPLSIKANMPANGSGSWSVIKGSGIIVNPLSDSTFISNFSYGENIFRWTITNSPCPATTDDIKVVVYQLPGKAIAGDDQLVFVENANLQAQQNTPGNGIWLSVNSIYFSNPSSEITSAYNLLVGENIFIWQKSNGNCPVSSDTIIVIRDNVVIPNAFSPNGDNSNDQFVIKGIESLGTIKLFVYNRWGSIVYEDNNYRNTWNGHNLAGEAMSDDTYFYVIQKENGKEIKGYILIKRD